MTNTELMQAIKDRWGATIDAACGASSVPASFLAALIANESGGDPNAKRFEPKVLLALWEVLLGRKAAYGSLGRADVRDFLVVPGAVTVGIEPDRSLLVVSGALQRLDGLATSQGLVQIMGYEAIPFHQNSAEALRNPATELVIATKMLADFAQRFSLDVSKDFSDLFDTWNTGRVHAPTFDPNYIPNGLARKAAYEALP
jgi:hypothetical protein